ncbi:hypothetical protein [Pigmentiphaga kullae]|uniref:Pectate lyase-like protein n=1 Tax=Pigmentiphaga kullae TaxID=151784 RepID=A0A4V2F409_9BURK|nr:hypothetical protein [Pigmentiphaga kullae]RZS85967.1 hypothetical protein EV675_1997 [Pigmentiphaga kullae]
MEKSKRRLLIQSGLSAAAMLFFPKKSLALERAKEEISAKDIASANRSRISILEFIPKDLHASIKNGTNRENLKPYIQAAVDKCIQNSTDLYVPAGLYVIDPSVDGAVRLNNLSRDSQGLYMIGEGINRTIFVEADGATERGGRFTKMFYYSIDDTKLKGGSFVFQKMTFDKNARSNRYPKRRYGYEQAHTFCWAGGSRSLVAEVVFNNCSFIDRAGACVNFSTSPTKFSKILVTNCESLEHPTAANKSWGQRGDFEFQCDCENVVVDSCRAIYVQSEPTEPSDTSRLRKTTIRNSTIGVVEYTDRGGFSYIEVFDSKIPQKFLVRGVHAKVINSEWKTKDYQSPITLQVTNSKIKLPYEKEKNRVQGLYIRNPTKGGYAVSAVFDKCSFVIDAGDDAINPRGFALIGAPAKEQQAPKFKFADCNFDSRLEGTCNAYRCGVWEFDGGKVAGRRVAFNAGADEGTYSELILQNVDFSNVHGFYLHINKNASRSYRVVVSGRYKKESWRETSSGKYAMGRGVERKLDLY